MSRHFQEMHIMQDHKMSLGFAACELHRHNKKVSLLVTPIHSHTTQFGSKLAHEKL